MNLIPTIQLILAHAMSNVAYIKFAWNDKSQKYSILMDAVVPVISTIVLIPIIIFAFDELTWPYVLSPILAGLWVLGSLIFGIYLYKNKKDKLEKAGTGDFSEVIITD